MLETKDKISVIPFFKESKNIWVSENFQSIFLDKYSPMEGDQKKTSVRSLNIQDIQNELDAPSLVFQDADTFLALLKTLIEGQMQGEEGKLLNDSSANYFFVLGKDGNHYSVLVRWEHAQKLWRCGAYLQEELKMPNIRIFYPG